MEINTEAIRMIIPYLALLPKDIRKSEIGKILKQVHPDNIIAIQALIMLSLDDVSDSGESVVQPAKEIVVSKPELSTKQEQEQDFDRFNPSSYRVLQEKHKNYLCETVEDWVFAINILHQIPKLNQKLYTEIKTRMMVCEDGEKIPRNIIELTNEYSFEKAYKSIMSFSISKSVSFLRSRQLKKQAQGIKIDEEHDKSICNIGVSWFLGWVSVNGRPRQMHTAHYGMQIKDSCGRFQWKKRSGTAYFPSVQRFYQRRMNMGVHEPYYIYDISGMMDQKLATQPTSIILSFEPLVFTEDTWHGFHEITHGEVPMKSTITKPQQMEWRM